MSETRSLFAEEAVRMAERDRRDAPHLYEEAQKAVQIAEIDAYRVVYDSVAKALTNEYNSLVPGSPPALALSKSVAARMRAECIRRGTVGLLGDGRSRAEVVRRAIMYVPTRTDWSNKPLHGQAYAVGRRYEYMCMAYGYVPGVSNSVRQGRAYMVLSAGKSVELMTMPSVIITWLTSKVELVLDEWCCVLDYLPQLEPQDDAFSWVSVLRDQVPKRSLRMVANIVRDVLRTIRCPDFDVTELQQYHQRDTMKRSAHEDPRRMEIIEQADVDHKRYRSPDQALVHMQNMYRSDLPNALHLGYAPYSEEIAAMQELSLSRGTRPLPASAHPDSRSLFDNEARILPVLPKDMVKMIAAYVGPTERTKRQPQQ